MLSEREICGLIPEVLKVLGGKATKKEIIDHIEQHCTLDPKEDLAKSGSRNEPKFYQRVGNIISHTPKVGSYCIEFPEGFLLMPNLDSNDKKNKWIFVLSPIVVANGMIPSPSVTVAKLQKPTFYTSKSKPQRIIKNRDYEKIHQDQMKTGLAGEEFVYNEEKKQVEIYCRSEIDRVKWASRDYGDGFGYDIQSVDIENPTRTKLIEVKATTAADSETAFYMSPNEKRVFESVLKNKKPNEDFLLYRLYKPNADLTQFEKKVITSEELMSDYDFQPNGFKVVKRKK